MGNCGSQLNCSSDIYYNNASEPLEVDPDIVGPGVLASFIISAAFAMLAIALGYFTDSLPRRHLHKIDRVFIRQSREAWLFSKLAPAIKAALHPIKRAAEKTNVFRIRLDAAPREIRSEALLRFLLVNSDQQLVTGLAVLTGGLARRCNLSGYEFQIVASLAWFSTTTHLATLSVLTNYFRKHPEVLLLRLVGMGATLILLCFTIVVGFLKQSPLRAPWQCTLGNLQSQGHEVFVVFLLLLYLSGAFITRIVNLAREAHQTEKELKEKAREVSQELSKSNSNSRTAELKEKGRELAKQIAEVAHHDSHEESGFINSYAKMVLWLYAHVTGTLPTGPDFHRILPIALENAERRRDAHFESATTTATRRSWIFYADLMSVDYCNSFAFGFSVLVFAFTFGIAQTISARNYTDGILINQKYTSEWGFGQIVPLFLLALPLLAAIEIYCESRRKAHSHFYALAIAEGDEEAKEDDAGDDSNSLTRTDTVMPRHYTTFFDDWHVRYGLRITVWGSTLALAFAGVAIEAQVPNVGVAGAVIIALILAFSIYATLREVHLGRKGMLEVIRAEAATIEKSDDVKNHAAQHSPRVDSSNEDTIQTAVVR